MHKAQKNLLADQSVPLTTKINDYFAAKVVDWSIKNIEKGRDTQFKWDLEDKQFLTKVFENPKTSGIDLPMKDTKFKRFVFSIIENGLSSGDVTMFQRYKNKLPLRSLGLAYDTNDFLLTKNSIRSKSLLSAGFYMLEIQLDPTAYSANIQLDCVASYTGDSNQSDVDADTFKLRAKSETLTKRLIWLRHDATVSLEIKSQQSEVHPKSDLTHLRFARLTKSFFLSRLFKKIGKDYDVDKHSAMSKSLLIKHWHQYDALFKPHAVSKDMRVHIGQSTLGRSVQSSDEQMKRILELIRSR